MCSDPKLYSEQQVHRVRRALVRRLDSAIQAIQRTKIRLDEALNAPEMIHKADLIKSALHTIPRNAREASIPDWEMDGEQVVIEFTPPQTPQELMKKLYARAHRIAKGIPKIESELARLTEKKEKIEELLKQYDAGVEITFSAHAQKNKTAEAVSRPYRIYNASTGEKILVGKDAESNKLITFHIAKGDDLWLHVANVEGAHVVVRRHNENITQKAIEEAALLAAYFSKKRVIGTRVEVSVAKRGDLYRKKGMAAGAVLMRTHTTITIDLDKEIVQTILNRQL